jgi:hypothetical protein
MAPSILVLLFETGGYNADGTVASIFVANDFVISA